MSETAGAQPAVPASTPAPAQPPAATPETRSATQAAVASGKTQDYRVSRRAERIGKPLAAVPVEAEAPTADATASEAEVAPAPAQPGKARQATRNEEYITNRIREGVERGTNELRAEIDRLKQQFQTHPPAEARREPEKPYDGLDPSDPKPAPDSFEDFHEYLDARDSWNERRIERKAAKAADGARVTQEQQELTAAQQARVQKFADQLKTATTTDPEFATKLTPEVRALKPFAALAPGEHGGPETIVAEQVFDSPIAPQVLLHFSEHPEALARLIAMPPEIQAMPARVRAHHHIQWIVKEFGKFEATLSAPPEPEKPAPAPSKTITSAPAPAQTLGSRPAAAVDPKAAAIKSQNTQAYREIRRRERAEQLTGRK